jgi:hypothetical protein
VKVTGVLSPERGPRDTKGARGGIPDEAADTAGYRSFPQTYGIETVESVGVLNGFFGGTGLTRSTQYTSETV